MSDIAHTYWEYFFGDGYDVYIFTVRAQTKNSLPVVEFFITDRNGDMPPQTLVTGNNTLPIPGLTLYIGDGLKADALVNVLVTNNNQKKEVRVNLGLTACLGLGYFKTLFDSFELPSILDFCYPQPALEIMDLTIPHESAHEIKKLLELELEKQKNREL